MVHGTPLPDPELLPEGADPCVLRGEDVADCPPPPPMILEFFAQSYRDSGRQKHFVTWRGNYSNMLFKNPLRTEEIFCEKFTTYSLGGPLEFESVAIFVIFLLVTKIL